MIDKGTMKAWFCLERYKIDMIMEDYEEPKYFSSSLMEAVEASEPNLSPGPGPNDRFSIKS